MIPVIGNLRLKRSSSQKSKILTSSSDKSTITNSSSCSSLLYSQNKTRNSLLSRKKALEPFPMLETVIAVHDYYPLDSRTDLTLERGKEYRVLEQEIDGSKDWWKVQNKYGEIGLIPSNYVKWKISLWKYNWFKPHLDRIAAEQVLKSENKDGCFVVRRSSSKDVLTISLMVRNVKQISVKHYLINVNEKGQFYIKNNNFFETVNELIHFHQHERGSLATKLKCVPNVKQNEVKVTSSNMHATKKIQFSACDKSWEIRANDLSLLEELGSGQFGVVRKGKWKEIVDVAVKLMKEGTMSEQEFIEEAKTMTKLQHTNLVQLYGVCIEHRPICIVTEFMKYGSLLSYLRKNENALKQRPMDLLAMCFQVCAGMAYLEANNYIHRDLAARNCLVGENSIVKVADFGLTRYVIDDEYTSSSGTKFPIKWAPPEVLRFTRFSSKSDVWAFGVLMWEMFTCGKMPYGKASNAQVVEMVIDGQRLDRPKICPREIFYLMKFCWEESPETRPSFVQLSTKLKRFVRENHCLFR
ncbi:Tyrosine-protein kinase Btk29A-like protein [Leptotrombidium deliense]|uniref:Tyrosine-protein kinase n=1 Tax=Leptotrombidium deliense TaxID=299467 RepID=A0A443SSP8_9ACAR|nr:Tyrosine-protein kinase Btk29A-like protein [Leptotrombidium deliense]